MHSETKMNGLDLEVKRSKVKFTMRLNTVKNLLLGPFCHHRTVNNNLLIDSAVSWMDLQFGEKWGQKVKGQGHDQTDVVDKWRGICIDSFQLNSVKLLEKITKRWRWCIWCVCVCVLMLHSCQPCDVSCRACTGPAVGDCMECTHSWWWEIGACVQNCSEGYYGVVLDGQRLCQMYGTFFWSSICFVLRNVCCIFSNSQLIQLECFFSDSVQAIR